MKAISAVKNSRTLRVDWAMTLRFKLGDKVKGVPNWPWGSQDQDKNGKRTVGVITAVRIDHHAGLFPYSVLWANGHKNTYEDKDLKPAQEGPINLDKWV